MNIFTDYSFYANQLWVLARILESFGILIFVLLKKRLNNRLNFFFLSVFFVYTVIGMFLIFKWKIFPECFIAGIGQTPFKIYSEYFICSILFFSCILIIRTRNNYDHLLFIQITSSIIITIFSELSFTLYTDNYGITNVIGHLLKIISFYLIYRSIIVNALMRPTEIIYYELNQAHKKTQDAYEIINNQKILLEQTIAELKLSNQSKDKFFKIISHDLRNPFTSIIGFVELLENRCSHSEKCSDQLKYIKWIKDSSNRAYKLLDNLLEWALLQTGEINYIPEPTDLTKLLNDIIFLIELQAVQKNVIIKNNSDKPLFALIDKDMISIVFRNIISNALKFSKSSSIITISSRQSESNIEIKISDTGIGIPVEHISKIFDVYSKYSTIGTNGEKGTGLGLILCKEFIKKKQWANQRS